MNNLKVIPSINKMIKQNKMKGEGRKGTPLLAYPEKFSMKTFTKGTIGSKEMIKQNKITRYFGMVFLVVLLLSFVSAADANNVSVMYGQNSSGAMVPLQTTDDGNTLKMEMNLMNFDIFSTDSSLNPSLCGSATLRMNLPQFNEKSKQNLGEEKII